MSPQPLGRHHICNGNVCECGEVQKMQAGQKHESVYNDYNIVNVNGICKCAFLHNI